MSTADTAIYRLLHPRSVAVIGASGDRNKTAGRPVAYLRKHGFAGPIFPVNPKLDRIDDLPCYPSIDAIPQAPDVGIVLLGAERAHVAVRDLAAKGCPAAIVLASGYGETGEDGVRRQKQLLEAAGPMRILGPNTIGLVNLTERIVLSASGALEMDPLPAGRIGVVSQSGGILGSLLSRAAARGIGMSTLISTSNEVDLELSDFIEALIDDEETRVIALYIETIRNPERFRAAAQRAQATGKPIVAFKVGRSEAGARAAVSHTGALAGADRLYNAFFRQLGVIRAQSFGDLLDMSAALATGRALHGNRVAVLTSTGGAGTLVSDCLGLSGFDTPPPDAATATALRALQTGDHAALDRNPIDVTLAGLQPDLLRGAIRALQASPSYDALIVIVGSSSLAMPELLAGALQDCLPLSDKPVLAYVSPHAPGVGALLTQRGVPAFFAAESCTAALAAMLQAHRSRDIAATPCAPALIPLEQMPTGSLDEAAAKALFSRFGIRGTRETIVRTAAEAEQAARALGGRVALKVLSADLAHKSDVGGVRLGVCAEDIGEQLRDLTDEVARRAGWRPQQFLVQEMVQGGVELIIGLRHDPLGTAILLGMGGVAAELFNDTVLQMLPPSCGVSREQATAMVRELRSFPLLDGYRNQPKADVDALVEAIVAFSNMAAQMGQHLVEAEINPIFVLTRGQGVCAADAVAVFAPADSSAQGQSETAACS